MMSSNTYKIFIYTALPCEAKPLIEHYKLKKDLTVHAFAVYLNNDICLVVSGLGKSSLWRAFWPFFVLVNVVLYYIDYRAMTETYTIASWKTVHGMLVLPIVWWIRSVWLCSQNTRYKLFSVAARTLTLYLLLEFILRFYISTQMPQTLFDCRLLILEYGDCV